MRRLAGLLVTLIFLFLTCQGCVKYVEEPTPAGQVAETLSTSTAR